MHKLNNNETCNNTVLGKTLPILLTRMLSIGFLVPALILSATAVLASSDKDDDGDQQRVCSTTAYLAFKACGKDRSDDYFISKANCINIVDDEARGECLGEAKEERSENTELCEEQLDARLDLCDELGEAPYDVSEMWVPENFVDPLQIGISIPANVYFPLITGQKVYEGGDETITVTVTAKTKLIEGVTCVVVNDIVEEDSQPVEDTDDWYAQDISGNVWYCGEISKNYEFFEGDNPEESELVDVEGSWKAFRDYAMPGVLMEANPQVGDLYRQEMSLGDAEDVAQVISIDADGMLNGDYCEEEGETIAEYIDAICVHDCLVTNEYTPIEPDVSEHKYYAPGMGLILEVNPDGECVIPAGVI